MQRDQQPVSFGSQSKRLSLVLSVRQCVCSVRYCRCFVTAYKMSVSSIQELQYSCGSRNISIKFDSNVIASPCLQNTVLEASLQLPPSLFSSLGSSGQAEEAVYKLHLLAFRNGKLFPPTGNSTVLSDGSKRRSVVTPVILTKIGKNTQLPWARSDMCSNPLHR